MREEPRSLLSLTKEELQTLEAAAAMVPPSERDQFLRSVANRWTRDFDLVGAIYQVLNGFGIAPGPSIFKEKQHATTNSNDRRRLRRERHAS
jgi:hypothetical protein